MVVEGAVGAQHNQPGAVQPASAGGLRGLERVGDQPGSPPGRVGAALAEPGRADHRSGQRSAHDRDQRVQALHPGVAEPGALLGVAVGRPDRVVDIDVGELVRTGQQRAAVGQFAEHAGGDAIELADMTESERPQERPHRRGAPNPAEQPVHPAVPQQVHVIDAVRASDHPRDQTRDLQVRVRATPGGQRQLGCDQLGQAATLRQRDHRRPAQRTTPGSDRRTPPTPRWGCEKVAFRGCSFCAGSCDSRQATFSLHSRASAVYDMPNSATSTVDPG